MTQEKRRFFRINETIGLRYKLLDKTSDPVDDAAADVLELVSQQDEKIEKLLLELNDESPKVAELIRVFNQKLERIVGQLVMDSHLVGRIASRVREVNISACGIGFVCDDQVADGSRLELELELFPDNNIIKTKGLLVACDRTESGYFWRVDFYDMRQASQEALIQHIVRRQSAQLKSNRSKG